MNQEYLEVCNPIYPNGDKNDDGTNGDRNDDDTNEDQKNFDHDLECTSSFPERVINFRRKKITELEEGHASGILLDDDTVIQPEVEVHVKVEDDVEDEDGILFVDEDGEYFTVTECSEDETISDVDTDLEEGEIRGEGWPSRWNNVAHTSYFNNYQNEAFVGYVCAVCGKQFSQKGNLLRHIQSHTGEKPHVCKLCGHQFTQKSNLDKHLATHNGVKQFICGICDKGFVQKANLMRHIRVHTGEKPFHCNLCGHRFTQKGNLNKHLELHNANTTTSCNTCGCTFSSYKAKLRHEISNHKKESRDDDEQYLSNQCTECPATFKRRNALSKHMKCHKKNKQKLKSKRK